MLRVSQIEDPQCDDSEVTKGPLKLTAKERPSKSSAKHQLRTSRQNCKGSGTAANSSEAQPGTREREHSERRNEERQARQKLKELGRLDELSFTPKLAEERRSEPPKESLD